jgi:hypothetical protein
MSELVVNKNTKFWMYVLDDKMWQHYKKNINKSDNNSMYFSTYEYYQIKKSDIVFYYIKNRHKSGFVAISRTSSLNDII